MSLTVVISLTLRMEWWIQVLALLKELGPTTVATRATPSRGSSTEHAPQVDGQARHPHVKVSKSCPAL